MKKTKPNYSWIIIVTLSSFVISLILGFFTNVVVNDLSIGISVFVIMLVICLGILFDIIGLAVATATEVPFHAKSAKKVNGSKESLALIRNAEKVSSFCNDVIGDIAGVLSGGLAMAVAVNVHKSFPLINGLIINLVFTAIVSSITVGGKAMGKNFAITKSYVIVETCGIIIFKFKRLFIHKKREN